MDVVSLIESNMTMSKPIFKLFSKRTTKVLHTVLYDATHASSTNQMEKTISSWESHLATSNFEVLSYQEPNPRSRTQFLIM